MVLAPVAGAKFAEARRIRPGRQNLNPLMTVTRRIRSPGRARNKPLKPLRAGMPGDPGGPVATTRVHYQLRTRGYGCNGHPAFPTPSRGREINAQLGRFAPRGANACLLFDNLHHPTRRPCESRDPYAVPCHFGHGVRGLLSQRTPVAMGPCFRRDDVGGFDCQTTDTTSRPAAQCARVVHLSLAP